MPPLPYLKLATYSIALLAGLITGWTLHSWKTDAQALAQLEADQSAIQAAVEQAKEIAKLRDSRTEVAAQLAIERERLSETVVKEVIRDVIRYVQTPAASSCGIDTIGVRIINASARVPATPETPGPSDASAGAVVTSVTQNYAICHRNATRLLALRDWIRAQYASPGT